jgi:hypothetical protein
MKAAEADALSWNLSYSAEKSASPAEQFAPKK